MSLTKPGSINSADRTAPPGVAAASSTVTFQPRSASKLAPTRPFGPAPITTASGMRSSMIQLVIVVGVASRLGRHRVHVVLDTGMTLDFERRVLDAELGGKHRLELGRPLLGVVQAQRPGEHHV